MLCIHYILHSHTDNIDWHIQWCVSLPSLYRRVYHLRMYRSSLNYIVENISDVEMALSMYMAAGASITPGILYTHTLSLSLSFFFHHPWYYTSLSLSLWILSSTPHPCTHLSLWLFLSSLLISLSLSLSLPCLHNMCLWLMLFLLTHKQVISGK